MGNRCADRKADKHAGGYITSDGLASHPEGSSNLYNSSAFVPLEPGKLRHCGTLTLHLNGQLLCGFNGQLRCGFVVSMKVMPL